MPTTPALLTRAALLAALVALGAACAPADGPGDAGSTDGGPSDAGSEPQPQPFPLALLDDVRTGSSFSFEFQGVVELHERATSWPDLFGERKPARILTLRDVGGNERSLYYSLPTGYGIAATRGTTVKLFYRELAASSGLSSHGVRITTPTGAPIAIFEDGSAGPAFDDAERFDIGFELDELALEELDDPCGRRIRYPIVVTVAGTSRRLSPGGSRDFELAGGTSVAFTLLDAYRLEDSVCGAAPPFSLAWFARPVTP